MVVDGHHDRRPLALSLSLLLVVRAIKWMIAPLLAGQRTGWRRSISIELWSTNLALPAKLATDARASKREAAAVATA